MQINKLIHISHEPMNYICGTLCELTRLVHDEWHWYKFFLIITSDIFISIITSIVVNQKYFKTSLSPY